MDQVGVGSGTDDKAGLVELKDVAQKFKVRACVAGAELHVAWRHRRCVIRQRYASWRLQDVARVERSPWTSGLSCQRYPQNVKIPPRGLETQGVLRGDPAVVQELRRQVVNDLEEVREEIEELLEVKVGVAGLWFNHIYLLSTQATSTADSLFLRQCCSRRGITQ